MSQAIDSENVLRELSEKQQRKVQEMIQGALQNDMVKIHLALGGMFACQELHKGFKAHLEGIERLAQFQQQKNRERLLRQQRRELARTRKRMELSSGRLKFKTNQSPALLGVIAE